MNNIKHNFVCFLCPKTIGYSKAHRPRLGGSLIIRNFVKKELVFFLNNNCLIKTSSIVLTILPLPPPFIPKEKLSGEMNGVRCKKNMWFHVFFAFSNLQTS